MLKADKQKFISELEGIYKDSSSIIVTHYRHLTVAQITELRKSLRNQGGGFKIVKNTLSKIAAANQELKELGDICSGPVAIAYSKNIVEVIKEIVKFSAANENLKIIGGLVESRILQPNQIQELAKLPSLIELRSKIIGLLQAPSSKIARILSTPAGNVARVIKAYSEQKN